MVWDCSVGSCHDDFFHCYEIFLLKDFSDTCHFKVLGRLRGGQASCVLSVSGVLTLKSGVKHAHRAINSPSS